jgi:hypothetical protein
MKFLFLFLSAVGLFAAPIGNPASPALLQEGLWIPDTVWCQPRASYLADFTMKKRLSGSRHLSKIEEGRISGNSSLGTLAWSIRERLDVAVTAGAGSNSFRFSLDGPSYEARYRNGLIWYGEAKLVVIEIKNTSICGFGEAGGWDWMSGRVTQDGELLAKRSHLLMRFWTAGAAVTQSIGWFTPYGGVIVMHSRWKLSHSTLGDVLLHQKYPVGPLFGCSIGNGSKALVNVEWRGWIENAVTVSAEIRF